MTLKNELKQELKQELKKELKEELVFELRTVFKTEMHKLQTEMHQLRAEMYKNNDELVQLISSGFEALDVTDKIKKHTLILNQHHQRIGKIEEAVFPN